MTFISIPEEVRELLDGPNYAHISTLQEDGSPRNHVVWIWREGDHVVVPTSRGQRKARDLDRDPRIGLSILDQDDPYQMAAIRGQVLEVRSGDDHTLMDRIARKYTGAPFPGNDPDLVYYVIGVTSAYQRTITGFSHNPDGLTPMPAGCCG